MPVILFLLVLAFWWMVMSITWWFPLFCLGLYALAYIVENSDWWINKRKKKKE